MSRYADVEKLPSGPSWDTLDDKEKVAVLSFLIQLPTADVEEVRHGEWVDGLDDIYWGETILSKSIVANVDIFPNLTKKQGYLTSQNDALSAAQKWKEIVMRDDEYVSKRKLFEMMCFYNVYPQDMSQLEFVDKLPNADVQEVKHGTWEKQVLVDDGFGGVRIGYICPVCKQFVPNRGNYCLECGAKMDGGE